MESLTQRQREILLTLVRLYLDWGEPVASADIADATGGKWSSATIRKELKTLEEMGFLEHPYKVAGRTPTVKAYRYFFNFLTLAPLWREDSLAFFKHIVDSAEQTVNAIKGVIDEVAASVREMSVGTYLPEEAVIVDMVFPEVGDRYIVGILLSTGEFVNVFVDKGDISPAILVDIKSDVVGKYLKDVYNDRNAYPVWFQELLTKAMKTRIMESGIEYLVDKSDVSGQVRYLLTKLKKDDWYARVMIGNTEPIIIFSEEFTDGTVKNWLIMVVKYSYKGSKGVIGLVGPRRYRPERIFETLWAAKKALEEGDDEANRSRSER